MKWPTTYWCLPLLPCRFICGSLAPSASVPLRLRSVYPCVSTACLSGSCGKSAPCLKTSVPLWMA
ncbi:Uncharacterised protein [Vibrio cholerae]|nr:Uncharacterised protein [Vibrio cholerae]